MAKKENNMYKKIEGVIVSEYPFEESSKIINILTKDGEYNIIAKGAKKIKSPLFAVTNKFTLGIFNIQYKEKGLSKLIDADIINNYSTIKKDINKVTYVTYITELCLKVYKHEPSSNIYDLYLVSLNKINEGYNYEIIFNILRLKLLDYLGIKPVIDKCIECGNTHNIVTISSYLGGYVCKDCYQNEKIVSPKTISLIRMLYYVDISKITKLDISKEILKEIEDFINDYYDRYSGIYLKSKTLLDYIK